jgi:hypothetical protein
MGLWLMGSLGLFVHGRASITILAPCSETCTSYLLCLKLLHKLVCLNLFSVLPNVFYYINFTTFIKHCWCPFEAEMQHMRAKLFLKEAPTYMLMPIL